MTDIQKRMLEIHIYNYDKEVLLRERKRHTARRVAVASACYAREGGGTPSQVQGGIPSQVWGVPRPRSRGRGYPVPCLGGYPIPGRGYPISGPARPGMGYPPPPARPGMGSPRPDLGWGNPPPKPDLGWGIPPWPRPGTGYPPPLQVWTDKQTENSTFPHPLDAGGKNAISLIRIY